MREHKSSAVKWLCDKTSFLVKVNVRLVLASAANDVQVSLHLLIVISKEEAVVLHHHLSTGA